MKPSYKFGSSLGCSHVQSCDDFLIKSIHEPFHDNFQVKQKSHVYSALSLIS